MTRENAVALVQTIYDAFNAGDLDRAVSVVSDDFTLVDFAGGVTMHGKEGFRQWLRVWRTAAPDAMTEVTNVIVEGEWVASEHTGRGTHTGPLLSPAGEIPATGKTFEPQFAEIFRVRDGQITLMRAYTDSGSLLQQLGLMPAPATA